MPYIKQEGRDRMEPALEELETCGPYDVGELTYLLYRVCKDYVYPAHRARYKDLAEVLGALEATKQEFYRRIVAPYEDKKIKENGDV